MARPRANHLKNCSLFYKLISLRCHKIDCHLIETWPLLNSHKPSVLHETPHAAISCSFFLISFYLPKFPNTSGLYIPSWQLLIPAQGLILTCCFFLCVCPLTPYFSFLFMYFNFLLSPESHLATIWSTVNGKGKKNKK